MLVRKSTEIALVRRIKPCEESIAQVAHNLSNLRAFYAIFVTSISGNKAHRTLPANTLPVCECLYTAFICKLRLHTHTPTHVRTLKVTQSWSIVARQVFHALFYIVYI